MATTAVASQLGEDGHDVVLEVHRREGALVRHRHLERDGVVPVQHVELCVTVGDSSQRGPFQHRRVAVADPECGVMGHIELPPVGAGGGDLELLQAIAAAQGDRVGCHPDRTRLAWECGGGGGCDQQPGEDCQ